MGYSCTAAANSTMGKIIDACFRQTKSQNVYKHGGKKYMWEIGKENADGAITGTIHEYLPTGHVKKAGTFRIEPNGTVSRGIGMNTLVDQKEPSSKKKERFTLQKYSYRGFQSDTGKPGEVIYVDLANKHPDPLKKLLWGYDKTGSMVSGDWSTFFEKIGKPCTFEFEQTGRYRAEEIKVRQDAIRRAIKKGW